MEGAGDHDPYLVAHLWHRHHNWDVSSIQLAVLGADPVVEVNRCLLPLSGCRPQLSPDDSTIEPDVSSGCTEALAAILEGAINITEDKVQRERCWLPFDVVFEFGRVTTTDNSDTLR